MSKKILKRKTKKINKRRINRKVKAINQEVRRLELMMKQRQPMTIGSAGFQGNTAPISAVSSNVAINDLRNELANQKDKIHDEIHKNEKNMLDIENKRDEDNENIKNNFDEHQRVLQNGLMFAAHVGTRLLNNEAARVSTRAEISTPIRTRFEPINIDYTSPLIFPVSSSSLQPPRHKPLIVDYIPSASIAASSSDAIEPDQEPYTINNIEHSIADIVAPITRAQYTMAQLRKMNLTDEQIAEMRMTPAEIQQKKRETMMKVNKNRGKK